MEDLHERHGVLAVQGPQQRRGARRARAADRPRLHVVRDADWQGAPVVVCRTGYTGERGYELVPRWEDAGALWDAVLEAGEPLGIRPCGLGARDTLRTEMGYPLHGQDLSLDITPVQARCGWAVGWKKPAFWGRDVLLAEKEAGAAGCCGGCEGLERGIPRPHMAVSTADGAAVGEVTSGTFSPTRKVGIALALLDRGVAEGDEVLGRRPRPRRPVPRRQAAVRDAVDKSSERRWPPATGPAARDDGCGQDVGRRETPG